LGVLLCHPGTQHAFALARQLQRHRCLNQLVTSLAWPRNGRVHTLLKSFAPAKLKQAENRIIDGVEANRIKLLPGAEIRAAVSRRLGTAKERSLLDRNRGFQAAISSRAIKCASAVIGFDTASWILAQRCRAAGKPFILDRSQAHVRAYETTLLRFSEQLSSPSAAFVDRPSELHEYEATELSLATRIVVASSFSRKTLVEQGVTPDKVLVNPYGVDIETFRPRDDGPNAELRFLFVGAVGLRKGVPLLVQTWAGLRTRAAKLTIAGPLEHTCAMPPETPGIAVIGKVARQDLPNLFREHDVFVFPSYFDGFGLVILEAMASGLPVITTDATAGPDLIKDGQDGFIVPVGDRDALSERMAYFMDQPQKTKQMGHAARARAERFTWDSYGDRWKAILQDIREA
jgi:alpha-maltose-1-phosphate synthase